MSPLSCVIRQGYVYELGWLDKFFDEHRPRLRGLAYRMLGSLDAADDAVQDAWLRLHRIDPDAVEDLSGWLTTVVSRLCRSRAERASLRQRDHE